MTLLSVVVHTVWLQIFVVENFHNFCNYMVITKILIMKFFVYHKLWISVLAILCVCHQISEFVQIFQFKFSTL